MGPVSSPVTLVVVCSANVCRSPLAEALLRHRIDRAGLSGEVRVHSAGIAAWPGQPMCDQAAAWAGLDPAAHTAREVDPAIVESADIVLTADRGHRAALARLAPACRPRLFTLRQAAGIAATLTDDLRAGQVPDQAPALPPQPVERLRWLVGELDAARGVLAGWPEDDVDIVDRHGPDTHPEAFAEVAAAVGIIADTLDAVLDLPTTDLD